MKISSLHVDGKPNESLVKPCGRAFCFVEASDEYNSVSTKFIPSYDTCVLYRRNNSKWELFWLFGKDACYSKVSHRRVT